MEVEKGVLHGHPVSHVHSHPAAVAHEHVSPAMTGSARDRRE
jgi:hypothetical protein